MKGKLDEQNENEENNPGVIAQYSVYVAM